MDFVDGSPVLNVMKFGRVIGDGYGLLSESFLLSQG